MNSCGDGQKRRKKIIVGGENYFWRREHNSVRRPTDTIKFHSFYFFLVVVRICCCSANICPSRPPIGETGPHGQQQRQCESVSSPQILVLDLMVLFPHPLQFFRPLSYIPFLFSISEGQPRFFFLLGPFSLLSFTFYSAIKQLKNLFTSEVISVQKINPLFPMQKFPSFISFILCCLCLFSLHFSSSVNVLAQSNAAERRLRYVQAIWRHGDRAPKKKPYEADIYDEKYWPRGWNQLTTLGMQQMQDLGRFFRNRYVGTFLSAEFRRKEVFIRSTAVDRAIESAQAMLSGMFPPTQMEQFNATLNWQPIPIHSAIDGQSDPLLRPSSFACPHYQKLKKEVKENLEEQLMPKYKDFAAHLRPVLNIPEDQPIKFRAITELKNIQLEFFHNLTQPDWVFKRWPKYGNKSTLELIVELRDKERVAEFNGSKELAKLSGGYLLGDWLKRAKKVANTSEGQEQNGKAQKMLLYSAHDGTLLALLSAFRVKNMALKMPSFASCIIMEIHESKMGQFFVEFYYRQNGQQLEPLIVGNCTSKSCPLDIFIESTKENAIFEVDSLYDKCDAQKCVMVKSGSMSNNNFNFTQMSRTIIFSIFLFSISHKFIVL